MKTVIFACLNNAGRSQMAAAFFTKYAAPTKAKAVSAGAAPAAGVHPEVIASMNEVSIDLSQVRPVLFTPDMAAKATILITMGGREACVQVPGLKTIDWNLTDPKGKDPGHVRSIRNQTEVRVKELIRDHNWDGF